MEVYKIGSKGEEVKKIQERLNKLGYYKGPIDGDFERGTEAGVIAFQKAKKLTADGLVGSETWKALFKKRFQSPPFSVNLLIIRVSRLQGALKREKAFQNVSRV
jgi:peptidoglycan hydrolase-like protein with peptidoglycan-binding domain